MAMTTKRTTHRSSFYSLNLATLSFLLIFLNILVCGSTEGEKGVGDVGRRRRNSKNSGNVDDPLRLKSSVPIPESALYNTGMYAPHVANVSSPVPPCYPRHVHLSVGVTPWDSVTVSFSLPRDCPPEHSRVALEYSVVGDERRRRRDDDEDTEDAIVPENAVEADFDAHGTEYNYTSTKHQFRKYRSDFLFHVPLTGLESERVYSYRISVYARASNGRTWADVGGVRGGEGRDDDSPAQSPLLSRTPLFSFETIAPPESRVGTRVAVVADLGQTYNSSVTMAHMYRETTLEKQRVSLVLCAGDCSYSDSNPHRWDSWFDLVEPLAARTPLALVAGNHEIECDAETYEVFAALEHRFRMPSSRPGRRPRNKELCLVENNRGRFRDTPSAAIFHYDYGNSYYAFTHGITRVIALNCYAPCKKGSRQYRWLEEELRSIDRTLTPWILVLVHCPFYNTFYDHHNEFNTRRMREAVEDLLRAHRVNLVVSGHSHGYLRTTGIHRDRVDPAGPVYLITGEGGNHEGHSPGYHSPDEPEEWVVKRDNTEYGFGTIDFVNASVAHWRWIRNFGPSTVDDNDNDGGREFTDEVYLENQLLSEFNNGYNGDGVKSTLGQELEDSV